MRIRIIGGGVAGLCLALSLRHRAGFEDVQVFERDPGNQPPDRPGHGLILMQNGVDALAAVGATDLLDGCTPLTAQRCAGARPTSGWGPRASTRACAGPSIRGSSGR